MSEYNIESLRNLFEYSLFVNVIDYDKAKACEAISAEYENSIISRSKQFIGEIKEAIRTKTLHLFKEKYCEAPFVIISIDEEDANKDAFQFELVYMLNVRHYKKLPTVFVTEKAMSEYPFSNIGIEYYSRSWNQLSLK